MKLLSILFLFLALHFSSSGQTIAYTLPKDLENTISPADYKVIVDQSVAIVSKRYKIDNVKTGTITTGDKEDRQVFNLDNLISKCVGQTDHSTWNEVIQAHFNTIFNSIDLQKKIAPQDYDAVKPYLSIRIYTNAAIETNGGTENLITRTDLEGTGTILMLDLPEAFTPVLKTDFNPWNKTTDEAFKAALENVSKQKMEKVSKVFNIDGHDIEFNFLENEDYAASYALNLETNAPDLVGEWGSVVAIPNKGLVVLCKMSKAKPLDFMAFIQCINPLIAKSYAEHPNPVSPGFYWYYKNKFTPIQLNINKDGNLNVIVPLGLSELMSVKN